MESEVLAPVHILTPLAGIALGAVLIFSYSVLGRWLVIGRSRRRSCSCWWVGPVRR